MSHHQLTATNNQQPTNNTNNQQQPQPTTDSNHNEAQPHGLYPDTMAPITSDCDAMRSPSIKRPE